MTNTPAALTDEMVEAAARQISPNCFWDNPPNPHQGRRCDLAREKARRALTAAMQHGQRIPGGWQLVPKEPTDLMIEAAYKKDDEWPANDWGNSIPAPFDEIYRAMLSAAPTAPK